MPNINALLEERKKVWDRMQEIRTQAAESDNGEFSAEQRTNWDAASARLTELSGDIERSQQGDEIQRQMDSLQTPRLSEHVEPAAADAPATRSASDRFGEAFDAFARRGIASLTPEQRSIMEGQFVGADADEFRALSVGTNTAGGYTVPPGFRDVLIETMKWYGSVRQEATVISSDNGQPLQWPTFNGTSQVGRILSENTALTQTDPAFGTATLGAYMYSSDLVLVPYQFLQDTAINVEEFLARNLGTRIGRIQNQHFTTGTGTAQPLGIDTSPVTGVTLPTGNTTSITYAGLQALVHSVDPAYRYGGSAKFMLSDTALMAAQLIVDSQNRPLWQPSLIQGQADQLLGFGYVVNNDMPVPAANAKSVLFGDFKRGYVVRDITGVQVVRLGERYADFLQVGWFAYARSDATVQDSSAFKALVQSAT
jgi:HK97 family phage major capsid protein